MAQTYIYRTLDENTKHVSIPDELQKYVNQAENDYTTSFSIIRTYFYDLWVDALKMYYLSTYDRSQRIKNHQSNIPYGLVRGTVDAMVAAITDKPLRFSAVGLNKEWIENANNVEHILNSISDITELHKSIPKVLAEGLLLGNFCLRSSYKPKSKQKKQPATSMVDDIPTQITFEDEITDVPYSTPVDMFNIFPDMYPGKKPRYVIERGVTTTSQFLSTFWSLINSQFNKSPLKTKDFIDSILKNENNAVFDDYGKIRMEIFREEARIAAEKNQFNLRTDFFRESPISDTYDTDTNLTSWLVEWRYCVYDDRIVLMVNNYPVYVGVNPEGFIPYKFCILDPLPNMRLGVGVPYMLRWLEDTGASIFNVMIDGQKAIANPTFIASRTAGLDEQQIEDDPSGGILFVDGDPNQAISRVEKGSITDFGMLSLFEQSGQRITGVSEYNMGIAARERTASGANAVVESSLRRLTPYLKRFSNELSDIGHIWLKFIRKYWTQDRFVLLLDEDGEQTYKMLSNKDTLGIYSISLDAEGMLAASKEAEFTKLTEMYNLTAGSGIVNTSEFIKTMFRSAGLNPNRFVVVENATIPANKINPSAQEDTPILPDIDRLQQINNPQPNFWNWGNGNPDTVPPSEL